MHETSSSLLPEKVHTDRRVAVPSEPLFHSASPDVEFSPSPPSSAPRRHGNLRMSLICLLLTVGLGAVLIPAVRMAYTASDGTYLSGGIGQALGQGLLSGGLPPTHSLGAAETDTEADRDTETNPFGPPMDTEGGWVSVPETDPDWISTNTSTESVTEPMDPETDMPPLSTIPNETEGESEPSTETDDPVEETAPPVPDGCYPIVSLDMSEQERGAGYVVGNTEDIPAHLPSGWLWGTDVPPTVLIVNTHPYEGYGDGSAWYDPAGGGLAVTDTPNATNGTVALGAALTRALRDRGVTVIHLRIAVSDEDTAAEIYDRTETMIRYYCRLYPDIGLVLNIRRSAELTPDGGVLRTTGNFGGEPCAQTRISVNGGRNGVSVERDLAVALALRQGLWEQEPTLSRPVWVKSAEGLIPDLTNVCVLTVEAGSAGNTYDESRRMIEPLATVLDELLQDNG